MRTLSALSLLLIAASFTHAQSPASPPVPLNEAHWELTGTAAAFTDYKGAHTLRLTDGGADQTGDNIVTLKDVTFANGTIEYDIALTDETRFTSIHFRRKDGADTEHLYLRANAVGDTSVNSAIQYAAVIDGVNLWDLSGDYQSNAHLLGDEWNHVKLVVRDRQLLAYVNDMERPALYVPRMDGDWERGSVGFDGTAYITNVVVQPGETPGLAPGAGYDLTDNDPRYLRIWRVSTPIGMPFGSEPTDAQVPDEQADWSTIRAERLGLINLSRRFGATPRGERRLVWLATTITAEEAQRRSLNLGFSDEVYVSLNGRPLYVDKNLYNTPGMKTPGGRLSVENTSIDLPLRAGENELLIGVTNFFFGWGLVARLDDGRGLRY